MSMLKSIVCDNLLSKILCLLLIAAAPASLVFGLPIGYKADFNGCAKDLNEVARTACCESTAKQCNEACGKIDPNKSPGAWIFCGDDCSDAEKQCKKGEIIEIRIGVPRGTVTAPVRTKPGQVKETETLINNKKRTK